MARSCPTVVAEFGGRCVQRCTSELHGPQCVCVPNQISMHDPSLWPLAPCARLAGKALLAKRLDALRSYMEQKKELPRSTTVWSFKGEQV